MTQSALLGLLAAAVGMVLLYFGWQGSTAPVDQLSEALTGRYSDATMWYLIGGLASLAIGAALIFRAIPRG